MRSSTKIFCVHAYQVQNTGRRLLLVCVLGEEEQTLSGDARPGSRGIGNVGLLAAKVVGQARRWDSGLLAEPEVLLGVTEDTSRALVDAFT